MRREPVRIQSARASAARPPMLPALMVHLLGWSLLATAVVLALETAA